MSSYKVRNVESIIAKKQLIWLVHGFETTTQWILHVLVLVLLDLLRCTFLKTFCLLLCNHVILLSHVC